MIDFTKWIKNDLHNNLISKLNEISNNILQWDQDVLNSFFNGKYLELENKLNFKASSKSTKEYIDEIIFIHYIGSNKPCLQVERLKKIQIFIMKTIVKFQTIHFILNINGKRDLYLICLKL